MVEPITKQFYKKKTTLPSRVLRMMLQLPYGRAAFDRPDYFPVYLSSEHKATEILLLVAGGLQYREAS